MNSNKAELKSIYNLLKRENNDSSRYFKVLANKWIRKLDHYKSNGNKIKYQMYLNRINRKINKINTVLEMRGGSEPLRDSYETRIPTKQNIFDRFKGNFATVFPNVYTGGYSHLSDDKRLHWCNSLFNLKDKNILECGPLELGHSYMMHNFGCKQITAVENNWYCYLKCLAVKESFKLSNVELLFGDVIEYLKKKSTNKFDFVLCSGILYHLPNPIELIHLISLVTENIFIWTHIYDEQSTTMKMQNINRTYIEYDGEVYSGGRQTYKDNGNSKLESLYCGGKFKISFWICEKDLYKALKKYGFINIQKNDELGDLNHVHGPCISIFASKN